MIEGESIKSSLKMVEQIGLGGAAEIVCALLGAKPVGKDAFQGRGSDIAHRRKSRGLGVGFC